MARREAVLIASSSGVCVFDFFRSLLGGLCSSSRARCAGADSVCQCASVLGEPAHVVSKARNKVMSVLDAPLELHSGKLHRVGRC